MLSKVSIQKKFGGMHRRQKGVAHIQENVETISTDKHLGMLYLADKNIKAAIIKF